MEKIVSFCNLEYIDVALNWAEHLNRLEISNYSVFTIDSQTTQALECNPIFKGDVLRLYPDSDFLKSCNNTIFRIKKLSELLMSEREDVLLCDLDALWFKNPLPLLQDRCEDIIFSTVRHSNAFPRKMLNQFGFTCCMGWALFRANSRTTDYLDNVYVSGGGVTGKAFGSDQKLFNNYLMDHVFNVCEDELGNIMRSDYIDSDDQTQCLSILCLNKEIIKRGPITKETYVWHPNTRKEALHKKEVFSQYDKWLI